MEKNELLMTYGTDYKEMTKRLLEEADLIGTMHSRETTASSGLSPNLVSGSDASWGATTHTEVVAGILEYLQEKGCKRLA